jgi:hypothetical protein
MQNGKPDHVRAFVPQYLIDAVRPALEGVGIKNVYGVAIGPEHGGDVVEPHGDGTHIFLIDALVKKIRVDEQYSHLMARMK